MNPDYYMKFVNNQLQAAYETSMQISQRAAFIHSQFRALVLSPQFPCAGAKTSFSQGLYRFGAYPLMGSSDATDALAYGLREFVKDQPSIGSTFTTFVATFESAKAYTHAEFVDLLWSQLQKLHDIDISEWDPKVSSDPESPEFSFSFSGKSFFVIGMHSASPRWARRFAWPSLVFNSHDQFEELRLQGTFEQLKRAIRNRDSALQGSINPILDNFGNSSEAFQYAGVIPSEQWKCPFKQKNKNNKIRRSTR